MIGHTLKHSKSPSSSMNTFQNSPSRFNHNSSGSPSAVNTYATTGGCHPSSESRFAYNNTNNNTTTGHLIPPRSNLSRTVMMGNTTTTTNAAVESPTFLTIYSKPIQQTQRQPQSNLTILLSQQQEDMMRPYPADQRRHSNNHLPQQCCLGYATNNTAQTMTQTDEADSASGHPIAIASCRSAPTYYPAAHNKRISTPPSSIPPHRSSSLTKVATATQQQRVRRCMSSKELGTLAPPSGSPYVNMLHKKEEIEVTMREKLREKRETIPLSSSLQKHGLLAAEDPLDSETGSSSTCPSLRGAGANETRNRRRAKHHQAVVNDLCEIVADLFVAESKLLKPAKYGVTHALATKSFQREEVLLSVRKFVSALPTRYALGVDTPSEVLLHMRLMSVARSDPSRAVVHVSNLEDDSEWRENNNLGKDRNRMRFLVTISCADTDGLLEYMTKLLGTGGSSVLDADVMLSSDRIVLDRFVVEMTGRLRLDKLAGLIEAFIQKKKSISGKEEEKRELPAVEGVSDQSQTAMSCSPPPGQLYFNLPTSSSNKASEALTSRDIEGAVPLTQVLSRPLSVDFLPNLNKNRDAFPELQRRNTSPRMTKTHTRQSQPQSSEHPSLDSDKNESMRQRRPLVNREASPDLDNIGLEEAEESRKDDDASVDYVTIRIPDVSSFSRFENNGMVREIPLIPFDDLMLIETLGTGRVSTIYRAAWQQGSLLGDAATPAGDVQMVALKVAMVTPGANGTAHVDELRREADIAARLEHTNVSKLVGVAADAECFCLAYEFCEGGSLLSLLSDSSRYYEYLPIALDIANGMAYLHSRNVIHRDLKPANILLSRDHRAQIADFGMSVANFGQELTAETGTYRYMAPEVIRHESYSSNADVYSFGLCLWQLITRQVPFASLTPIQAAYAVAEGHRPEIPRSTPQRLQEIIRSCWHQDSHRRPSFTYIVMALADYAKQAFSPATVGAQTLQIANDMLANVEGNATVNVDFTTSVAAQHSLDYIHRSLDNCGNFVDDDDSPATVGLEIE